MSPAQLLPTSTWKKVKPPSLSDHSKKIQALIHRLQTPQQVQRWIRSLHYNAAATMRTLPGVFRSKQAHCLEAAMTAAVILEHHGYPPLILDLESADKLDHTLFLYRHGGKFGTVGKSRDVGLDGRKPVYQNLRTLAQSYAAPYIDHHAAITGYGVLDLRTLKSDTWRRSSGNVWRVEEALRQLPHRRLKFSSHYIRYWRRRYATFKQHSPLKQPNYYPHQENWA